MKQILGLLIMCALFSCEVGGEGPEVSELVPGELIGYSTDTYYQEYNVNMGTNSVEGYIDMTALSQKVDTLGYPALRIGFGLFYEKSVPTDAGGTVGVHVDVPTVSSIFISPNIDTGYYKISGLPDVDLVVDTGAGEIAGRVGIDISQAVWDTERFHIRTFFTPDAWNDNPGTKSIEEAVYRKPDPSITLTVNMIYRVDTYWMQNDGVFEDPDAGASYQELTYDQIEAIAPISVGEDGYGGLFFFSRPFIGEGVSYGLAYSPTRNEYKNQQFTINSLIGGQYREMSCGIVVGGNSFSSPITTFPSNLSLTSDMSATRTVIIYIPEQ